MQEIMYENLNIPLIDLYKQGAYENLESFFLFDEIIAASSGTQVTLLEAINDARDTLLEGFEFKDSETYKSLQSLINLTIGYNPDSIAQRLLFKEEGYTELQKSTFCVEVTECEEHNELTLTTMAITGKEETALFSRSCICRKTQAIKPSAHIQFFINLAKEIAQERTAMNKKCFIGACK